MEAHRDMGFLPPVIKLTQFGSFNHEVSEIVKSPLTLDAINSLENLRGYMGDCSRCKLHKERTHMVFGEGNHQAELVFVGEAPGRDEDISGRPFVGEAGNQLTKIIENGMRLSRNDIYILNTVKCRPPKNRDPEKEEVESCLPFLKKQISLIKPKVICGLGRVAGQAMLGADFKISKDRGKWFSFMDIPLMVTYHPAYLLRYPSAKRQVWDDVKMIMKHLGLEVKKS